MSRTYKLGEQCDHGRLARKCPECQCDEEIAELREELRVALTTLAEYRRRITELEAEVALCSKAEQMTHESDKQAEFLLIACPHCSGTDLVIATDGRWIHGPYSVQCVRCGARGGERPRKEAAGAIWNRALTEYRAVKAQLEQARRFLDIGGMQVVIDEYRARVAELEAEVARLREQVISMQDYLSAAIEVLDSAGDYVRDAIRGRGTSEPKLGEVCAHDHGTDAPPMPAESQQTLICVRCETILPLPPYCPTCAHQTERIVEFAQRQNCTFHEAIIRAVELGLRWANDGGRNMDRQIKVAAVGDMIEQLEKEAGN